MKHITTFPLFLFLFSLTVPGQDAPAPKAEPMPKAPTRIVLEEKQVGGGMAPVETKLTDGAKIRTKSGAAVSIVKYVMSDKRDDTLQALKIMGGEVGVDCSPKKKLSVWVPDGQVDLKGGAHSFLVVKDGWRQVCLSPRAVVEERRTGAKWSMGEQQKVRVERAQSCVLITHERDSEESIYVSIPANWIVHTLKGEDLKKDSERIFAGEAVSGFRKEQPIKVPIIIRLDPADAVLILPPELPAAGRERIEVPGAIRSGGLHSPFR